MRWPGSPAPLVRAKHAPYMALSWRGPCTEVHTHQVPQPRLSRGGQAQGGKWGTQLGGGEKKTLQRGIAPAKPAAPNPRPAPLARAPRPPVSLAQFLGVRDSFWAFAAPSGCSWTLQSVSHCLLPSSQSDTRGHMARVKFAENVAGTADGVCKKTTECLPHHVASFKVYLPMRLHTF